MNDRHSYYPNWEIDFLRRDLIVWDYIDIPVAILVEHPQYNEETTAAVALLINSSAETFIKQWTEAFNESGNSRQTG